MCVFFSLSEGTHFSSLKRRFTKKNLPVINISAKHAKFSK